MSGASVGAAERTSAAQVSCAAGSEDDVWSAAAGIPVTVVRQLLDPVTPLELQDEMIRRLPSPELVTVVDLATGHVPAVTHPREMAAILAEVIGA